MVPIATLTVEEEMTCGTSYTATISKPSHTPAYTVILKQTIRDETTRLLASSSATSYSFNFSTSLFDPATYGIEAARISSLPVTLTLETWVMYNNIVDFIGANTYDVTVKVPMSSPTISISGYSLDYVTDGIAADFLAAEQASNLHFTNGLTKIKTTAISATPQNYAYISKIYVTGLINATVFTNTANPPQQYRGRIDVAGWNSVLNTPQTSGKVYFTAVDSRGNTATYMQGLMLSTISAPTLSNVTWTRGEMVSNSFSPSASGSVMRMTATLSSQTGSASIKFSRNGTAVATNSYNSGSITYLFSSCLPTANTELLVEVDNVLATSSYSYIATITTPDINYNTALPGIAFGKVADEANTIDSEWGIKTAGIMQAQYVDVLHNTSNSPQVRYRFSDKDNAICGNAYVAFASGGGGRFYFREHSANTSGTMLSYYEQYRLPTPDGNRSSNASYDILTTKNDGQLTLTYTSNTYVSSTAFNRLYVYRRGNILIVRGNLQITTAMPSSNSAYTIGTISDWNGAYEVDLTVPAQDGSGTLLVIITTAGKINIYNTSGSTIAANAFCRFNVAVPV